MVSPGPGGSFRRPFRNSRAKVGGERVHTCLRRLCLLPRSSPNTCPVRGGAETNGPARAPRASGSFFPLE
eukprot:16392474-Heterocapsa_arctica.AAC.1